MTVPRDAMRYKAAQWVAYADEDLRLAEHALSMPKPPYRLVAYHAQQCAEKWLKACLVLRGIDFPYTHNISLLLELCESLGDWTVELSDAEHLSAYAITSRYPGVDEQVSRDEAATAIDTAKQVREAVRGAVHDQGLEL